MSEQNRITYNALQHDFAFRYRRSISPLVTSIFLPQTRKKSDFVDSNFNFPFFNYPSSCRRFFLFTIHWIMFLSSCRVGCCNFRIGCWNSRIVPISAISLVTLFKNQENPSNAEYYETGKFAWKGSFLFSKFDCECLYYEREYKPAVLRTGAIVSVASWSLHMLMNRERRLIHQCYSKAYCHSNVYDSSINWCFTHSQMF